MNLDLFVDSYLETAKWVFCGEIEGDFSQEAIGTAQKDCKIFIDKVFDHFGQKKGMELLMTGGQDLPYLAAHDFFLTRNGHGAGFWDKPEKYGSKESDCLTHIAVEMGESNVYWGDCNVLELDTWN